MKINRRYVLGATTAFAALGLMAGAAAAQDTIKIGEINSYSGMPGFTQPYRKAWELALEEINKKGGVLGKKLEVVARDDGGKPGDAVKIAEEMVVNDKVVMIGGTFLSNIGLAVTDFAAQKKVFFLAAEPLADQIVWEKGNRYTFRLRASTYSQAMMLVAEAKKSKAKKWATIAPNYAYGQDAVKAFVALLKKERPDVEIVAQQWPANARIDAGAEVQALLKAAPEGIFNVTFGGDLAKFVKEGNARGLFKDRTVVSLLTGEPEYADPLGADMPEGWIVTGYPWSKIKTPEHEAFLKAYQAKYNDYPRRVADQGGARHPIEIADGRLFLPRARPAIDARRLRRAHHGRGRQAHDEELALCRRREIHAARRRSEEVAPGGRDEIARRFPSPALRERRGPLAASAQRAANGR
jgi:branched-chain amino acid transport system substrate-binding protein